MRATFEDAAAAAASAAAAAAREEAAVAVCATTAAREDAVAAAAREDAAAAANVLNLQAERPVLPPHTGHSAPAAPFMLHLRPWCPTASP